jgi:hypothetical protein
VNLTTPLCAVGCLLTASHALAEPADYVATPIVEAGEREVDFKVGRAAGAGGRHDAAASLGFGYGASERWFTEVYLKYKDENSAGGKFDAVEWENKLQLTETGKYPVDLGVLLEIEHPQDHAEGWEVRWGPLLQTEFGKWQLNLNLFLQRNYRAELPSTMQFLYQWQTKYRWRKELEFGIQGFGETGSWHDWLPRDEQNHRIGPALFGKFGIGGGHQLEYNVAWLFGASRAAPAHTLRAQLEFEF